MKVVLGTKNKGKLREIKSLIKNLYKNLEIESLESFKIKEPEESGFSFLENAYIKAKFYYDQIKIPILSEDSGLEVYIPEFKMSSFFLPGIYSSRFYNYVFSNLDIFSEKFNIDKTFLKIFLEDISFMDKDEKNIKTLLFLLEKKYKNDLENLKIKASFVSYLCLVVNDSFFLFSKGKVNGYILSEERGDKGFGYDPIFFYKPFKKTFAELTLEEKNKVSHRAQAFKILLENIKRLKNEF